jgi:hypothetical protein
MVDRDRFEPIDEPGALHPAFRRSAVHNALASIEPEPEPTVDADQAAADRGRR